VERQAAALLEKGRFDEAEAKYRQLLASGTASASALVSYAALCGRTERFDAMVPLLQRALVLEPDLPEAHLNLGVALRRQGDLAGAIAAYRQALQLRPHNPDGWHNLGLALEAEGKPNEAALAYRRALQLRPTSPATLTQLAGVLAG
jgi:tetratricopeptide (TPR) repeat protein